ncbi:MAG: hypothetical protein ACFFHV_05450 [Promethearchaeota archaeon]
MTELENNKEFLRFFRRFLPSEIHIDKNNIFYRDKYNEIINYIKLVVSNSQDLELFNYLEPKGGLLVNLNPGTDIIDFFKLISSNYYLEYFEIDYTEVLKAPEEFFNNFNVVVDYFSTARNEKSAHPAKKKQDNESKTDEKISKKLILINQKPKLKEILQNKSLLDNFLNLFNTQNRKFDFIHNDTILVWLNYNYEELVENSEKIFNIFDLFIKVPFLNSVERKTYLKDFAEKNSRIVFDINALVNYTENWEINDIKQILKMGIFKHFLNADLNDISNEITDTLINIIESGEYVLSTAFISPEVKNSIGIKQETQFNMKRDVAVLENQKDSIEKKDQYINQIRDESISEFMTNQLYENAASKNYSELLIVIDKLNKREALEDNERKLLAKYPFILNDSPNMAQINLEKAKKRVDLIKRAFGK